MKCPHCGEETMGGKACGRCGKDLAPPQGVEVQYKDFKVSELLDIKLRTEAPSGKEIPKTRAGEEKQRAETSAGKKRSWLVATAIVLAMAIAVFFLLRFLLKF